MDTSRPSTKSRTLVDGAPTFTAIPSIRNTSALGVGAISCLQKRTRLAERSKLYGSPGYARPPARRAGRPVLEDTTTWTVTDDWPEEVPITEAEIEVFEAWFGDLFDELFSTRH